MAAASPLLSLSSIIRDQLSGTLSLVQDKVVRQFFFHTGNLSNALSNAKSELPGSFLHKEGKISADGYGDYLTKIKSAKPNLWGTALEIAKLSAEESAGLRKKYGLLLLKTVLQSSNSSAQFSPGDPTKLEPKIVEGLRFLTDAVEFFPVQEIPKICPDFGEKSSIYLDAATEKKFSPLPFSPEEKGLLTVIAHNSILSEVFSSSFLGKERISRLILVLWLIGMVRLEDPQTVARKAHEKSLSPADQKKAQHYRTISHSFDNTSYYQWLGVQPTQPFDQIKDAFQALAEEYSAPSILKLFFEVEKSIPDRLIGKIQEAAKVLLNPEQRGEYDAYLATGKTGSFVGHSKVGKDLDLLTKVAQVAPQDPLKALELLEGGMKATPDSVRLICEYAKIGLQVGEKLSPEKKERVFQELRRGGSLPSATYELFETFGLWTEKVGNAKDAIEAFKKALMIWPFSSTAADGLNRLAPNVSDSMAVETIFKNRKNWNHYQMLGLPNRSNVKDVQRAYRECTKRFHPDRFFKSEDAKLKSMANEIYKQMVKAYTTLKNSGKRSEYDRTLQT